jgi:soluble lytic murein transglycosylase-like protein
MGVRCICVSLLTNGYVKQHFLPQIRKAVRKHYRYLVASEFVSASESESLSVRFPSSYRVHPLARRLLAQSMVMAPRMWGLVGLCCLGLAGVAHAAPGATVAAPASTSVCASGWDQLLTPAQRDAEALVRGCQASAPKAAKPVLAAQMGVYRHTSSRLLPVGAGARTAQPAMAGKPQTQPRTAPSSRSPGAQPLRTSSPVGLAPLVDRTAQEHDIDPLLLHSIARVESRHQPDAISHAGARGLMQVIPPTARRFGVDGAEQLHDPQTNLRVSARYLKTLQQRFGNDLELVLAAYNAGEGAVEKHGRKIPPYRETQDYVRKVLSEYALLRGVSAQQTVQPPSGKDVL